MRLFIIFAIFLASCGTTHKVVTREKKTSDSSVVTSVDTTRVIQEQASASQITAQDIHVRIEYPQSRSISKDTTRTYVSRKPAAKTGNKVVDAITSAIAAAGGSGQIPSSIQIDIGSISDSAASTARKDSGAGKSTQTTAVHTENTSTHKEVTRWHLTWWMWLIIVAVVLYAAYRLNKKFNWIRIFP